MAATIKEISKKTGLGFATISAYLNGVTVRPKNKLAIEKAIEELGYVRNEYARGLKTHRTMTIGVLIPELNNAFSTAIISEMEDVLRQKGYGVIVCDCKADSEIEKQSLRFLISKMVDGLIIMPISTDGKILQAAVERNIPTVVIDRITDNKNVGYIVINNRQVSFDAVKALTNAGHSRVALIAGDRDMYTAKERAEGYKAALDEKASYDESLVFDGKLSIEGGYVAMKSIIENHPSVTALFVTNYEMTIGALVAINRLGKKIYEDYSFVGFDNQELANVVTPKLSTVNQPLAEIGKNAAQMLIAQIGGEKPKTLILEAEICEGGSIKQSL